MKLCRAPYGLGNSSDEASVIGQCMPAQKMGTCGHHVKKNALVCIGQQLLTAKGPSYRCLPVVGTRTFSTHRNADTLSLW